MKSKLVVSLLLVLLASSASALTLGQGSCMLAFGLTSGSADVAAALTDPGYISAFSVAEVGVQGQFWYMLRDDYAMTLAGGVGFSSETDSPGTGAATNAPDRTQKSTSFNVRLGGDRVVKIAERALMYGGPGIEFFRGKAKLEGFGSIGDPPYETEWTTRIALSARIGATLVLSDAVGLTAQVGHHLGRASAKEKGAEATWWPSGFDGAMGFMFMFGGK